MATRHDLHFSPEASGIGPESPSLLDLSKLALERRSDVHSTPADPSTSALD